jgi:MoaD family protein
MITARFYTILREKLGVDRLEFEASDVEEALDAIEQALGRGFKEILMEEGRIRKAFILLLNGRVVNKDDLAGTPLTDGDVLHFFPPIAGG